MSGLSSGREPHMGEPGKVKVKRLTPRTDAFVAACNARSSVGTKEAVEFARSLERERDRLSKDNEVLRKALRQLLDYTGGWDLTQKDHPIVIARKALEQCES